MLSMLADRVLACDVCRSSMTCIQSQQRQQQQMLYCYLGTGRAGCLLSIMDCCQIPGNMLMIVIRAINRSEIAPKAVLEMS